METLVQQVKDALQCMYGPSSREAFKEAESWLQKFQRSQEAWQVANVLLSEEGNTVETLFFAADTLHLKISYDFAEFPPDRVNELRDTLVRHLSMWTQRPGGSTAARDTLNPFLTKLCVAIAALSVQINWQGVLNELVNAMLTNNVPKDIILVLIEVLPEECQSDKIVMNDENRESFRRQLLTTTGDVFNFLVSLSSASAESTVLQTRIFTCLETWIHHFPELPATSFVDHPVIDQAFGVTRGGAQSGHLFDAAVNLLVEILIAYDSSEPNMGLVQFLVPRVMALAPSYAQAVTTEDVDTARGYCKIFTEMGESYMQLLVAEHDLNQIELVNRVLECTAHPDTNINQLTLRFWWRLTEELGRMASDAARQMKIRQFTDCFNQLVVIYIRLMRYPDNYDSLSEDQREDFIQHRYQVGDAMNDVAGVLGGAYCLRLVGAQMMGEMNQLLQKSQHGSWQSVEACLWATRSLAANVPPDEAESMPQVVQVILNLPEEPKLRNTANHVVGRYARWIRHHGTFLEPLYRYLLDGLTNPITATSAAISIRDICTACGHMMGEPVLSLYDQLTQARASKQIMFKDELMVMEGLATVVSTLPPPSARQAVQRMVHPLAVELQALVVQQASNSSPGAPEQASAPSPSPRMVAENLDRVTVIIRHAEPRGSRNEGGAGVAASPAFETIQAMWTIFEAVVKVYRTHEDILEKVCRCFKHSLRAGKDAFIPMLDDLIRFFTSSFEATHASSFIYACSIMVSVFGGHEALQPRLLHTVEAISTVTMGMLKSLADFTEHPDVVEEYFYLMARFLHQCPKALITSHEQHGLISIALQYAIAGLEVQHREAQKGILHFLETLVKVGLDDGQGLGPRVRNILVNQGQALVHKVVNGLVGEMPSYLVDESGGSLAGLLWKLSRLCPDLLQHWVVSVLAQTLSDQIVPSSEKSVFVNVVGAYASKDEFVGVVRKFGRRCRDSMRRWRKSAQT